MITWLTTNAGLAGGVGAVAVVAVVAGVVISASPDPEKASIVAAQGDAPAVVLKATAKTQMPKVQVAETPVETKVQEVAPVPVAETAAPATEDMAAQTPVVVSVADGADEKVNEQAEPAKAARVEETGDAAKAEDVADTPTVVVEDETPTSGDIVVALVAPQPKPKIALAPVAKGEDVLEPAPAVTAATKGEPKQVKEATDTVVPPADPAAESEGPAPVADVEKPIEKPQTEQPQTAPEKVAVLLPNEEPTPVVTPKAVKAEPKLATPEKAPNVTTDLATPGFDLVRIDGDGAAVIAGSAEPGQVVRIRIGQTTLQTVTADSAGSFVALMDLPASTTAQPLVLEAYTPSGQIVPSADNVLVLPFTPAQNTPPKIILASVGGVSVLQGADVQTDVVATGAVMTQNQEVSAKPDLGAPESFDLSLDIISYDQTGDVVLAGRGASDNFVRVYVDNRPIETESVLSDGQWRVILPAVKEGVYTLRVDQIDAAGVVTSRVESPFKREEQKRAATAPIGGSITVQPGHTLWELAREQYGDGVNYVQIFDANRDRIRNPNLIYPGQVFALP